MYHILVVGFLFSLLVHVSPFPFFTTFAAPTDTPFFQVEEAEV